MDKNKKNKNQLDCSLTRTNPNITLKEVVACDIEDLIHDVKNEMIINWKGDEYYG